MSGFITVVAYMVAGAFVWEMLGGSIKNTVTKWRGKI